MAHTRASSRERLGEGGGSTAPRFDAGRSAGLGGYLGMVPLEFPWFPIPRASDAWQVWTRDVVCLITSCGSRLVWDPAVPAVGEAGSVWNDKLCGSEQIELCQKCSCRKNEARSVSMSLPG